MSDGDLMASATRLGASERQIRRFPSLRQTFMEFEVSLRRQNREPEYVPEGERGAAELEGLVQSAIKKTGRDGGWFRGVPDRLFG